MATLARRLDRHLLAFCAVLLLAAGLRLHGLDWDQGQHQHPDERHISDVLSDRLYFPPRHGLAELFDPGASDLNPRSNDRASGRPRQFAYGSLPLLLTDVVACGAELLTGHTCRGDGQGTRYWTTYDHQYLVGRFLTVLADLALIVVTYALARRAFGAAAGLIAGAFLAVSVVNIQLAHFFATDTWSALFATAALWALYRAAERGPFADWRDWALAGVLTGASVASKLNTFVLVVPAAVALWYSLRGEMSDWPALGLRRAALLGLSTLAAFAILEPYALPAWSTYWRDFNEQAGIIGGSVDVPYTRQFTGALPVWHYAWNLWGYGLGVGLTGLGLAGLAASAWRVWRRRSAIDLLLLAWFLAYGIVINTVFAKFLRYTLPLAPVLAILGGALAARLLQGLGAGRQSLPLPLGEGRAEGVSEEEGRGRVLPYPRNWNRPREPATRSLFSLRWRWRPSSTNSMADATRAGFPCAPRDRIASVRPPTSLAWVMYSSEDIVSDVSMLSPRSKLPISSSRSAIAKCRLKTFTVARWTSRSTTFSSEVSPTDSSSILPPVVDTSADRSLMRGATCRSRRRIERRRAFASMLS